MAADLHIHVMPDDESVTDKDISDFFSNTLGSKYFNPWGQSNWLDACKKIGDTPSVWIGEVSWLKQAFLSETEGEFVPDVVNSVHEIIGEDLPVCDDALIERLSHAFDRAVEHSFYSTASRDKVVHFLEEHRGKRLFTVSW